MRVCVCVCCGVLAVSCGWSITQWLREEITDWRVLFGGKVEDGSDFLRDFLSVFYVDDFQLLHAVFSPDFAETPFSSNTLKTERG